MVSLDLRLVHSLVPVCKVDLASQKGQKFVWSLLDSCHPAYVHLGLPADTVTSRSHSSQDLRSLQHPWGRPELLEDSVDGQRVAEANRLYTFAFDVAVFCIRHNIPFCLENPPRSLVWPLFTSLAVASDEEGLAGTWNNLESVDLHTCMFGGARAKPLRFLCPAGLFSNLAIACDRSHSHRPWLQSRSRAEIAEDASYPPELCVKMVTQLLAFLRASHAPLPSPVRLHDQALASVGKQSRRFQPLIPEYREIVRLPHDHPLPSGAKVLSASQLQGVSKASPVPSQPSEDVTVPVPSQPEDVIVPVPSQPEDVTVGLWHSPAEFFTKACSLAHPMDTIKPVAMVTKAAIDAFLHGDAASLAKRRTDFLDYLEKKIARLKPHEEALHRAMPDYMQKVLKDKNLLAWEEILKETGYPDLDCVRFMKEGVKLIGCEEHPKDFAKKVVPATLSEAELRSTARHRRSSLETLGRGHLSDEDATLLAQATAEEVEAGFLERGMSAKEVSDFFGHREWAVVRRFVLIQDGGRKVRPIDDCLEAQLNSAFTSTIALQLQDSDYISSLALFIAERLQSVKPSLRTRWLGKTLDLSKAYKQMVVHPRDRDLCVIMVRGPKDKVTYHICNALVFGASASVFAFVRISKTLWWIMNKCLGVPGGYFFDDYPIFAPEHSAEAVDRDISRMLDLLGWKHAKSGSKGKPFQSAFDVLGMQLNLGSILEGKIVLANKEGRAEKILEKVSQASSGNGCFRQSLQVLMGHLNFASGFFAGRALRHVAYDLNQLLGHDWLSAKVSLDDLAKRITVILHSSPPRVLSTGHTRQPILVWTDGAWEGGRAGIGAVEWDPLSKTGGVWAGVVPERITNLWMQSESSEPEQIISQVELYAMSLIRHLQQHAWRNRRVILFCDNEAARFASIKGGSSSSSMNRLVQAWDAPNFGKPAYIWVERVPSYSNISDGPSRGNPEEAMALVKTNSCQAFVSTPELEALLTNRRSMDMG